MQQQPPVESQQQPASFGQQQYQSGQGGQTFGQWSGQLGGQQGGQSMGQRWQDVETPQEHEALYGILQAIETCEWCADQCIQLADQNMVECIRRCEDVSELGETVLALQPRRSPYAQSVMSTFLQAAQQCAQECSQHSHSHCQECAQVLGQTIEDTQKLLASSGQQSMQGGQQSMQGGQPHQGGQQGYQAGQQTAQGGAQFGFQ